MSSQPYLLNSSDKTRAPSTQPETPAGSHHAIAAMGVQLSRLCAGEVPSWHSLPPEVTEHVWGLMLTELPHDCRRVMRGVCRSWRAYHDARCRTLKITPDAAVDNFRAVFGRFSALVELEMCDSSTLTSEKLQQLASVGLPHLQSLDLSYSDEAFSITPLGRGYEALGLGGFPALQSLKLMGCEVTDAAARSISTISTLTRLNLGW